MKTAKDYAQELLSLLFLWLGIFVIIFSYLSSSSIDDFDYYTGFFDGYLGDNIRVRNNSGLECMYFKIENLDAITSENPNPEFADNVKVEVWYHTTGRNYKSPSSKSPYNYIDQLKVGQRYIIKWESHWWNTYWYLIAAIGVILFVLGVIGMIVYRNDCC